VLIVDQMGVKATPELLGIHTNMAGAVPDNIDKIGLIAHTCVEATVRFGVELGYEVTMVKDATADYSDEEMHAALDVNIPNYASAVVTTNEIIDSISSL
jgi:nicotinamidase-related amidase